MSVRLPVHSNIRDYVAYMESDAGFIKELAVRPQTVFIVDENVWKHYSDNLLTYLPATETIILSINEKKKSLETVQKLYDQLVDQPAKRNLTMISLGGGILQDITGFVASTLYRGIEWIYIPTTLLAQADSCIGSKTSLNYQQYKNLIGTFYPPSQIHIYPDFIQTQTDNDYLSGLGEVIKLHLMGGSNMYSHLKAKLPDILQRKSNVVTKAIEDCLKTKLGYITEDEFDTGQRNLLNYGHDFGHAIENTSRFAVPHGQAVIVGMLAANIIARQRQLLDPALEDDIAKTMLIPSIKIKPQPEALENNAIILAMKQDKKRTGDQLALIMMINNFNFTRTNDLSEDEVRNALIEIKRRLL